MTESKSHGVNGDNGIKGKVHRKTAVWRNGGIDDISVIIIMMKWKAGRQ